MADPCCIHKTVGPVSYTLISSNDTTIASTYGCKSNCVYEQDDQPGSAFCFAAGDLPAACKGLTVSRNRKYFIFILYFQSKGGTLMLFSLVLLVLVVEVWAQ